MQAQVRRLNLSQNNYKFAIGIIDNSEILEGKFKTISCNIADYLIVDYFINGYKIFIEDTPEKILEKAADLNYDAILIISLGSYFNPLFLNVLKNTFEKVIKNKIALIGHILDRKESYFELHEQNFIINLNWWKLNKPSVGKEKELLGEIIEPIRSEDNYHDDYTPTWIKQGNQNKKYIGKSFYGWNLIKSALESDYQVCPYSVEEREHKKFCYPKEKNYKKLYSFVSNIRRNKNVVYVSSSEKIPLNENYYKIVNENKSLLDYDIDCVLVPASGIMSIAYPFMCNLKDNDSVIISFDYNKQSLIAIKDIIENWNLEDNWEEYIKYYIEKHNLHNNSNKHTSQVLIDLLKNNKFCNYFKNYKNINKKYVELDLFNAEQVENLMNDTLNYNGIFFHVSNIFHYEMTALDWSWDERLHLRNQFLLTLKKYTSKDKNIFVNFLGNKIDGLQSVVNINLLDKDFYNKHYQHLIGFSDNLYELYFKRKWKQPTL